MTASLAHPWATKLPLATLRSPLDLNPMYVLSSHITQAPLPPQLQATYVVATNTAKGIRGTAHKQQACGYSDQNDKI